MKFSNEKFKIKKDSYLKSRDNNVKFLYISCGKCNEPVIIYQKDGIGNLYRFYYDRIVWPPNLTETHTKLLICPRCKQIIANHMIYEQENRDAYRIIPGTIHKYRSPEQAESRR